MRILGLIHAIFKPALDYLRVNYVNGEVPVRRGQKHTQSGSGWADWKQRAAFCWRCIAHFPAQESQQATGLLPVLPPPSPFQAHLYDFCYLVLFCQGSPTHPFVLHNWCLQRSCPVAQQLHHSLKPLCIMVSMEICWYEGLHPQNSVIDVLFPALIAAPEQDVMPCAENRPQDFRASQAARQELDAVLGERGCKEEKVLALTKCLGKLVCNFLFWSSFIYKTGGERP